MRTTARHTARVQEWRAMHLGLRQSSRITTMSELGCQLEQAIPQNNNRHKSMAESTEPTLGGAGRQQSPARNVSGLAPTQGQGWAILANSAST